MWYRALARDGKKNKFCEKWVFDEEQTDNMVSPWETIASRQHSKWRSTYPTLAALHNPRARRGIFKPNEIVEAPESMQVCAMPSGHPRGA